MTQPGKGMDDGIEGTVYMCVCTHVCACVRVYVCLPAHMQENTPLDLMQMLLGNHPGACDGAC